MPFIGGILFLMVIFPLTDKDETGMESIKERITKEAKRIEKDSFYSVKGHFIAANSYANLIYGWEFHLELFLQSPDSFF